MHSNQFIESYLLDSCWRLRLFCGTNMLILAVRLAIWQWDVISSDWLLEPASSGHLKNCSFWPLSAGLISQPLWLHHICDFHIKFDSSQVWLQISTHKGRCLFLSYHTERKTHTLVHIQYTHTHIHLHKHTYQSSVPFYTNRSLFIFQRCHMCQMPKGLAGSLTELNKTELNKTQMCWSWRGSCCVARICLFCVEIKEAHIHKLKT